MPLAPPSRLPPPPPEAEEQSRRLAALIRREIDASGGWVGFARFMELALYAPGLGYYSAGSLKFGRDGDFVTAPELSPLFGRCVARQIGELVAAGLPDVLELGAGSGALAADALQELAAIGRPPARYLILEVSADLRDLQRATIARRIPALAHLVQWVDVLPRGLRGTVIANEVLDAIPARIVQTGARTIDELGVTCDAAGAFAWAARAADPALAAAIRALDLPDGYRTEINPAAGALVQSLARLLEAGALLFIDYGFPAREYYHPQRAEGTLMCHYRQHAHADPLVLVGLQGITAHVDFTAVAHAGVAGGLEMLGYATQAHFLINCGITDLLAEVPASDVRAYAPLAAGAQKLLSPAEMGELFKVIALGRGVAQPLLGFRAGDRSHTL